MVQYEFISSEVKALETAISNTSSSNVRQKRADELSLAMFFSLEPRRKCAETGFRVSVKEKQVWKGFSKDLSCC